MEKLTELSEKIKKRTLYWKLAFYGSGALILFRQIERVVLHELTFVSFLLLTLAELIVWLLLFLFLWGMITDAPTRQYRSVFQQSCVRPALEAVFSELVYAPGALLSEQAAEAAIQAKLRDARPAATAYSYLDDVPMPAGSPGACFRQMQQAAGKMLRWNLRAENFISG